MDSTLYLLLYITTLVAATWFSFIAASTDIATPNVPTTQPHDHLTTGKDIQYDVSHDVTTMAPKDFFQSETLSASVQTTDLPSDMVLNNDQEPLVSTVISTHASSTTEDHRRTVPYEEGALSGITTPGGVNRTFEMTSATVSLTDLRNRQGGEFETVSLSSTVETIVENYTETATMSSDHLTSFRKSTSAARQRTRMASTSSEETGDFQVGSDHQKDEIPEEPVHRQRNEGLVTEANINHAALWITVAFVAVLLVYITVLIIYNAKKRDWHQSLPPYTRFVEENSQEERETPGTLDRIIQRITGKKDTEDGYSLSF